MPPPCSPVCFLRQRMWLVLDNRHPGPVLKSSQAGPDCGPLGQRWLCFTHSSDHISPPATACWAGLGWADQGQVSVSVTLPRFNFTDGKTEARESMAARGSERSECVCVCWGGP